MLELRKTHSMVQVSELMGVPRSTLRHWMSQIAERFEACGRRSLAQFVGDGGGIREPLECEEVVPV